MRNRDRLYRIGGDEFAIMCPDLSAQEAKGMLTRVASSLKDKAVPKTVADGSQPPFIKLSIGIAECRDTIYIKENFLEADKLAIESKNGGRDRITLDV